MMRGLVLCALALAALAGPAMAGEACIVPFSPTIPNGATATRDQILNTRDLVTAFIKASDDYQSCLNLYLQQQEEAAQRSREPVDPAIKAGILAKGEANQREKVRVGDEFNIAVRAFNTAQAPAPEN